VEERGSGGAGLGLEEGAGGVGADDSAGGLVHDAPVGGEMVGRVLAVEGCAGEELERLVVFAAEGFCGVDHGAVVWSGVDAAGGQVEVESVKTVGFAPLLVPGLPATQANVCHIDVDGPFVGNAAEDAGIAVGGAAVVEGRELLDGGDAVAALGEGRGDAAAGDAET